MAMYVGAGVLSGSSSDTLDICCVEFVGDEELDRWNYNVLRTETVSISDTWRQRLLTAHEASGEQLIRLHSDYGHFVGETMHKFMEDNRDIDDLKYIAHYGHSVFHQPQNRFTFQLGDGETMASHVDIPVVTNFRTKDVALGGQGAPLVYVGERHLFSECNIFLNLHAVASVSVEGKSFDIAPCNMLLNYLSERLSNPKRYDEDGKMAESGTVIPDLLDKLNNLPYFKETPPKTLGREWFGKEVIPLLDTKRHSITDLLCTSVEHITDQITNAFSTYARDNSDEPVRLENTLLITGGGACNIFLMKTLARKLSRLATPLTICEVDENTILFKDAIILAFIGLRTLLGFPNTRSSVTGASTDAICGSVHLPATGKELVPHLNKTCPFHIMRKKSRASTTSFGSTEQLQIPSSLAPPQPSPLSIDDSLKVMGDEAPRRMNRTLTQ